MLVSRALDRTKKIRKADADVLSMFQDHGVYENWEIFRLGRVLGRQEASLVDKKPGQL